MTHLTLITSQKPRLQMPSHWGLGLQHINFLFVRGEGNTSIHPRTEVNRVSTLRGQHTGTEPMVTLPLQWSQARARIRTQMNSFLPSSLSVRNTQCIFNQTWEAQIAHNSRNASSYYGFISEENEIKKICFIVKAKATFSHMCLNHLALNRIFNYKYTKFGSRID